VGVFVLLLCVQWFSRCIHCPPPRHATPQGEGARTRAHAAAHSKPNKNSPTAGPWRPRSSRRGLLRNAAACFIPMGGCTGGSLARERRKQGPGFRSAFAPPRNNPPPCRDTGHGRFQNKGKYRTNTMHTSCSGRGRLSHTCCWASLLLGGSKQPGAPAQGLMPPCCAGPRACCCRLLPFAHGRVPRSAFFQGVFSLQAW
jgi:hypothetical protein